MGTLLELLPRNTSNSSQTLEEIVELKCRDMLEQIPQQFSIDKISKQFPV